MSLVVICPSCGTVFTMVREQLESSNGRVRCGHCMQVFDAQAQLMDVSNRELAANLMQHGLSTAPDSALLHADLSFMQHSKKEQFWLTPKMQIWLALSVCVLLILLANQIIRHEHLRLIRLMPSTAPLIQKLCDASACTSPARRVLDGWLIESSSFQKIGSNAFRLTATLKNISQNTLIVPQLELTLLDSSDLLLVRRVIAPDVNNFAALSSGDEHASQWLITPKATTNLRLNIKDIAGYRLIVFYP